MPISPLPTPPSRGANPEAFSSQADALLGALPTFVTETNANAVAVQGLKTDVQGLKTDVQGLKTQADDARDAAVSARDVTIAARDVTIAARDSAVVAAAAAGAAAGLPSLSGQAGKFMRVAAGAGSVEWGALDPATTSAAGVVQLSTSTSSTSTTQAATPSAVKAVADSLSGYCQFTTSSSATLTDYPVGSVVLVSDNSAYSRNAAANIYYDVSLPQLFQTDASGGVLLSGTWRARGCGSATGDSILFQRVA